MGFFGRIKEGLARTTVGLAPFLAMFAKRLAVVGHDGNQSGIEQAPRP